MASLLASIRHQSFLHHVPHRNSGHSFCRTVTGTAKFNRMSEEGKRIQMECYDEHSESCFAAVRASSLGPRRDNV